MYHQKNMALAQIIQSNPILGSGETTERTEYFDMLMDYLRRAKWRSRWIKAESNLYRNMMYAKGDSREKVLPEEKCLFLLADIAAITGYNPRMKDSVGGKKIQYLLRKRNKWGSEKDFKNYADAVWGRNKNAWEKVSLFRCSEGLRKYLNLIKINQEFLQVEPIKVMVTALMSAGKSTFINALVGSKICWSQNVACTSKIHVITGKAYDDCFVYEDDHILRLHASQDILFDDDERNKESKISVSSYFHSSLAGRRIEIYDSPGVNSSLNIEHRDITYNIIKKQVFDLYIYLMNATQLMTDNEAEYLKFIKDKIKKKKIIFVINKIDELDTEDESLEDIIKNVRKFVISIGFEKPVIYAVSAEAALSGRVMASKDISRQERRNLEFLLADLMAHKSDTESINYDLYDEDDVRIYSDLVKVSGILPIEKEIINTKRER